MSVPGGGLGRIGGKKGMPQRKLDRDDVFHASRKREEGQTMAEYSVVLAVITVASVAVFPAFGAAALNVVTKVTGLLP